MRVFLNQFDGGPGGYAGHGIATERRDVRTLEPAGNFRRGHGQAHRHSIRHAFRAGDHVRDDFPILDAEPFLSGASPAGLHFISDEQRAILLNDLEDHLEVFLRRRNKPADALNRFGDERGDVPAGPGLDEVFHVTGAGHFAIGILQVQGATVAIRTHGMRNAHADDASLAIRRVCGDGFG